MTATHHRRYARLHERELPCETRWGAVCTISGIGARTGGGRSRVLRLRQFKCDSSRDARMRRIRTSGSSEFLDSTNSKLYLPSKHCTRFKGDLSAACCGVGEQSSVEQPFGSKSYRRVQDRQRHSLPVTWPKHASNS